MLDTDKSTLHTIIHSESDSEANSEAGFEANSASFDRFQAQ